MTPDETLKELNACLQDWQGFVANKNATLRRKLLAWPNHTPSIEREITWDTIASLASKKQYSFQLRDGSLVQMLYDFSSKGSQLASASLAYYESRVEEELEEEDGEVSPLAESLTEASPKWLRMDFTDLEHGSCIHSACHLHLAGFPETRIGCAGVPGPRQFLESLMAWLYPSQYRGVVLCMEDGERRQRYIDINRLCHHVAPVDQFNSIIHVALPPSIRSPILVGEAQVR
jgi:hypothetical protein